MRDNQRSKVYKAEQVIRETGEKFETVKEVERYLETVKKKAFIARRYGTELNKCEIRVEDGRGCKRAFGGYYGIVLPKWARKESVILHEVAHLIQYRKYKKYDVEGHGWEFCDIFLNLVQGMLGKETRDILQKSFKENKVRFRPKSTRTFSEEHRKALAERMKKIHCSLTQKV